MIDVNEIAHILESAAAGDFSRQIGEEDIDPALRPVLSPLRECLERMQKHEQQISEAREQAEWYEAILDRIPFPITVTDMNMNWTFINKGFEDQWGRDRVRDRGISCMATKGPLCNEGECGIIKLRRSGKDEITTLFEKDGASFQLDVAYLKNKEGEKIGHIEIVQDITALKQTEKEAQEKAEWYEAIIDRLPLPISVTDMNMNWTFINKFWEDQWGRDRVRDCGTCCMATKGPLCNEEECGVIKLRRSGKDEIKTLFEKDGASFQLDVAYLKNEEGEKIGHIEIIQDITALKQAEKEAQEQARLLAESAEEMRKAMDTMAAGDLTALVKIEDGDPLKQLKLNYRQARESLKETLTEIATVASQVDDGTKETSRSAEDIAKAIEQVATTSQKSAEGARKSLENIEEIARTMADLSASVEEIASTSQDVLQKTGEAAELGDQAEILGKEASGKMRGVEGIARKSVEEITRLNDQMQEISKIVKLINDISNQTNLLALNAAIEAARAGEHGRGFAVVAGEVRNLAGESKKATNDIENLISTIQTTTDKTAENMESAYSEINSGISSVEKAIEALNTIAKASKEANQNIGEIAKATEDQASATNRAMEAMERTRTEVQQNIKGIENMAALTEEVSASAQEVGGGAQEMAGLAENLKKRLDKFTL
ncbi:methyl-accepting chemotaxis protein [Methanofollis ethanolicus]|uniref:methyl-accepting chemotaxis protein n=1 Tax=Methanofollis ethanolicus TaxID=488124 RepID=UPI0008338C95|nr:methyl-accepting chemotaxis protein [Methanofollis ethanolicus]